MLEMKIIGSWLKMKTPRKYVTTILLNVRFKEKNVLEEHNKQNNYHID